MQPTRIYLFILWFCSIGLHSCVMLKNPERPIPENEPDGHFFTTSDGTRLFVYDYRPGSSHRSTIFLISGITGINHHAEMDIIRLLSQEENRVVVIHPRGTGYSEGIRGDLPDRETFVRDYREIILADADYRGKSHPIYLYGHSMSCAIALAVANEMKNLSGVILINPPLVQKRAKGMSPGLGDFLKYAVYMLFAPHTPVVNMAGDPKLIQNEDDRRESEQRINDTLLVKYHSMHAMTETQRLLKSMIGYARTADYPLLLIYGLQDPITDQRGCDELYAAWKHPDKKYLLIPTGSHGKSTVLLAADSITAWIRR